MQLIRKLLSLKRPAIGRNGKIRGLSTAELVGIIVIVGILGALGGTYIAGLVGQAQTNAIAQNVSSLNTVAASAIAGGATATAGGVPANGGIDITTLTGPANSVITSLNAGISVGNVTYRMSPPISGNAINTGTYQCAVSGSGANTTITFSAIANASVP
jgi:type II secretory pathway pseudopilin PulG